MASTPDYNWRRWTNAMSSASPISAWTGRQKDSGRAKYGSDLKPQGLLFGVYLSSPYAHARITRIDTGDAEKRRRQSGTRD